MARRKPNAAERARRLLAMLPHFTVDHPVRLEALAEAVGATPEEIADDIGRLSLCGAPPYTPGDLFEVFVEDDGLVYTYMPPPGLGRPVRLSLAEARAALAALDAAGFGPEDAVVRALSAAAEPGFEAEEVRRQLRTSQTAHGVGTTYERLQRAAAEGEAVEIEYWTAGRDAKTRRVVHPYALGLDLGAWYLSAFCERAGEVRTFRLDRVLSVHGTGRTFDPPKETVSPLPSFAAATLPRAEVRFAAGEDVSERDWPGASFTRHPDGSVTALVPFSSPGWLARRVAARLGGAEVTGPAIVREAVAALARAERR